MKIVITALLLALTARCQPPIAQPLPYPLHWDNATGVTIYDGQNLKVEGTINALGGIIGIANGGIPVVVDNTGNDQYYLGCPTTPITQLNNGTQVVLIAGTANITGSILTFNLCGLGAHPLRGIDGISYNMPNALGNNNPVLLTYSSGTQAWYRQDRMTPFAMCSSENSNSTTAYNCTGTVPFLDYYSMLVIGSGVIWFSPANTNTASSTLSINSGPAVSLVRFDGSSSQSGDLVGGVWYMLTFDGLHYRLPSGSKNNLGSVVIAYTTSKALSPNNCGALTTFNGSGLTATLPSTPVANCVYLIQNLNSSALAVSPSGLTINLNAASVNLLQGQTATIQTDGANYYAGVQAEDGIGNVQLPNALLTGVGSIFSGFTGWGGASSGSQVIGVADIAGTHVAMVWPAADGTTGQYLQLGASVACSTLIATWPTIPNFTFPANCRQLSWVNAPTIGTPTVGQAACIKSAGPPVTIGYCSTTPTNGTCTCN